MTRKFMVCAEPFAWVDPIAVEDIQHIVWKLKDKNIGILITDHNVQETLSITDRAYLLFEGKILFQGTPEELAATQSVREKLLRNRFVLRRKDFQLREIRGWPELSRFFLGWQVGSWRIKLYCCNLFG